MSRIFLSSGSVVFSVSLFLCVPQALGQSEDFGVWRSLFNGKDTSGWVVARGPNAGKKPEKWSVADGALTNGNGRVDDICTTEEFDNFELELQYKVPPRGNSGVYLRGQVEVQILDSYGKKTEKLGTGDAGALYGVSKPLANPQNPPNTWNTFRIRFIGNRVTVWHNGVLVQDNTYVEKPTLGGLEINPLTGKRLTFGKGPIMLQGDHTKVWYRKIRVRRLCSPADGWKAIWNGKDLSAFTCRGAKVEDYWRIDDHAVTNKGHRRDMWTKQSFGNFLVHYEYRSDPKVHGGNSGFYLRDQWEIQILSRQSTTNPHSDGSLYSIYPPARLARHGPTNWNHMDVKLVGMKIWVWQNGKLIHDGVVCKTRTDNHSVKTDRFTKAPFKFQGDHGDVWFTNLYIKVLPDTP